MDIIALLRVALAESWAFYFLAHSHHWNVRGQNFPELHKFFGEIYDDVHGAVDDLAERLRTLGALAPSSLDAISAGSTIIFTDPPVAVRMIIQLQDGNAAVTRALAAVNDAAEEADNDGLANFLQERLDVHAKWGWMLKAYTET